MTQTQTSAPDGTPVFILGVGAQKAGTSWLYDYLDKHPQCAMAPIKEVHFFDFHLEPESASGMVRRLSLLEREIDKEIARIGPEKPFDHDGERLLGMFERLSMQVQPERYLEMFAAVRRAHPEAKVIGEITPGYAILDADGFRMAREWIVDRIGARPRVVFLMRDPVRRCLSQLNMTHRMQTKTARWRGEGSPEKKGIVKAATSDKAAIRTRYERTIETLEQVFAPEELYYGFYEEVFSDEEIRRICAFLGIDPVKADFDTRANASAPVYEPSEKQLAKIREFYAPTYAFCRERFGAERVDGLWRAGR